MQNLPLISVIVIGRNEGQRLSRCLASVRENQYRQIEIIYIDSQSSDDSVLRATCLADRIYHAQTAGAAAARNLGLLHAKGEWIMFLDGDTRLAPQFLAQALATLEQDATLAGVWGHRIERHPDQSIYVQVLDLDWRYPAGESEFCGGDALFRRTALEQVNGFNPTLLAGEEPEMCFRLRQMGWKIQHLDLAMTQHDLAITRFSQYWQRSCRAGYAYAAVSALQNAFWASEVKHNFKQMGVLCTLLALLLACAQLPYAALAALGIFLALILRSSWRARWRSPHWPTLLLYGLHSWLAPIPIHFGIWRYRLAQGQKRSFADYKAQKS